LGLDVLSSQSDLALGVDLGSEDRVVTRRFVHDPHDGLMSPDAFDALEQGRVTGQVEVPSVRSIPPRHAMRGEDQGIGELAYGGGVGPVRVLRDEDAPHRGG
jgi:hypothetical protein